MLSYIMKKYLLYMATAAIVIAFTSCRTSYTSDGTSAAEIVDSYTGSVNDVNLIIANEPITYTIDISTEEGRAKLNGLSYDEARSLCLREAVMSARCAKLVNPQYTKLMKGRRVLRVTVYGFPATYKNQAPTQ